MDALGQTWEYLYASDHLLTEVLDPGGVTVERTEYDAEGRAVRQYDGLDNLVVEITYNADGTSTIVYSRSNSKTHVYNSRNTLTDEVDAAGETSSDATISTSAPPPSPTRMRTQRTLPGAPTERILPGSSTPKVAKLICCTIP